MRLSFPDALAAVQALNRNASDVSAFGSCSDTLDSLRLVLLDKLSRREPRACEQPLR
jgi:hypothetical protein